MRYADQNEIFNFDHFLCVEMREHIFGLGLISLQFNKFEGALKYMMELYVDYTVSALLFDKASNEQRAKALRTLVNAKEKDKEIVGHIEHLLTYFAICAENRNVLLHSSETWERDPASPGKLPLRKPLKSGGSHLFDLELADIQRVFADILAGLKYCLGVYDLIKKVKPGPLEKPELPTRLSPQRYSVL